MANKFDIAYDHLVRNIQTEGELIEGRNGPMTELFGPSISFNLELEFPILTGRKLYPRGVFGELSAFLKGASTLAEFEAEGCNYWEDWAFSDGSLGPIYGFQWRKWGPDGHDQIRALIEGIHKRPHSRRHVVTAWEPTALNLMCLPPCYPTFQVRIGPGTRYRGRGFQKQPMPLDLVVNQRSADVMIGLPSDIILFATLMHLLANETGMIPRNLTFHLGSAHIYWAHHHTANEYLERDKPDGYSILASHNMRVDTFIPAMVQVHNYQPLPPLKFELFK